MADIWRESDVGTMRSRHGRKQKEEVREHNEWREVSRSNSKPTSCKHRRRAELCGDISNESNWKVDIRTDNSYRGLSANGIW